MTLAEGLYAVPLRPFPLLGALLLPPPAILRPENVQVGFLHLTALIYVAPVASVAPCPFPPPTRVIYSH